MRHNEHHVSILRNVFNAIAGQIATDSIEASHALHYIMHNRRVHNWLCSDKDVECFFYNGVQFPYFVADILISYGYKRFRDDFELIDFIKVYLGGYKYAAISEEQKRFILELFMGTCRKIRIAVITDCDKHSSFQTSGTMSNGETYSSETPEMVLSGMHGEKILIHPSSNEACHSNAMKFSIAKGWFTCWQAVSDQCELYTKVPPFVSDSNDGGKRITSSHGDNIMKLCSLIARATS